MLALLSFLIEGELFNLNSDSMANRRTIIHDPINETWHCLALDILFIVQRVEFVEFVI